MKENSSNTDSFPYLVVISESFYGCPVHDHSSYSGWWKIEDEEHLKRWCLENLNEIHVMDIVPINTKDDYKVFYEQSSHNYSGIILYKNNKKISRTIDDGKGNLVWEN